MIWEIVLECPKCGAQTAAGQAGTTYSGAISGVWCNMGHEKTEMEQKLPEAWYDPWTMEQ